MPFRVTTSDGNTTEVLKTFRDNLQAMRRRFEIELFALTRMRVQIDSEKIENMFTLPTGQGVPRVIAKDPLPPVDVFSQPEGKGIKYRAEADGAFVVNNSSVCYLFDEWQQAGRNVVTGTLAALPVGSSVTIDDLQFTKNSQEEASIGFEDEIEAGLDTKVPLPYVPPPLPKWEQPAAQNEAQRVDHDVRFVRDIFDQPLPKPPEFITTKIATQVPLVGAVQIDPTGSPRDLKLVIGTGTFFQTGTPPLQAGDTIIIGVPTLPPPLPDPPPGPFNLSFKAIIASVDSETQLTLTESFPDVFPALKDPSNPPWPASPLPDIPFPAVPVSLQVVQDVTLPVPTPAAVQAITKPFEIIQGLSANPIEPIVTPLTPLINFKDKTETGYDATILGTPPPPSILPGPFGLGKGRTFVGGTLGGRVEIEPLLEGPPAKPLLRQGPGPEMALSAVFRPVQPLPGTGWTLASNSSPIPAIPFATTNYSLQLVESGGHLFPRLVWQWYDTGAVVAAAHQAGSAAVVAGYGILVIAATGGAAASLAAATVAKRTAYAQSFVPFPMPPNTAYGYPGSLPPGVPPPPPGLPHSSKYFLGVTRWKKELPLQTMPMSVQPTFPYMGFGPNFDGILNNPAMALEPVRMGDYVALGNDGPVYFTNSYELWKPYEGAVGPGGEVLGGLWFTWPAFYLGNPPTIFPFPKGKKLYSLGVTFYLGDLETGNFFIDDFPLYGTDDLGLIHGSIFTPGHNNNPPFPNVGELSDFYIGADLQTPFYTPPFLLNGMVNQAGLAAALSGGTLDTYAIITAGHQPLPIPSPLPFPAPVYQGDYYMLNIPSSIGTSKQERDRKMTELFNSCFPDYNRIAKIISRSPRSQIPNGDAVYVNYTTEIDLPEAEEDSETIRSTIDALLAPSSNPDTDDTDRVAAAVGVPPPRTDPNDTELDLEPYGIHLVNGQPYLPGDVPVDGFKHLVDNIGYPPAVDICVGQPSRPVLVISIEERSESPAVDSCGNSFFRLNITERILGIDISTQEALRLAGVEDPGLLILRLYWVGGLQVPTVEVQNKLDSFQLDPADKSSALLGESNGTIEVLEIPDQNIVTKLPGSAVDIQKLFVSRNPVLLNISPTAAQMRTAITSIISSPAAATADGEPGPAPPFMGLFRTLDLAKAFNVTQADMDELGDQLAAEVTELCNALFQGVSSCILNANLSVEAYQLALAPALELLNFNVGMTKLNLDTYIPCLGNFTASMAVPTSGSVDLTIPRLPSPEQLLDRLRATVQEVASMAEKALAALDPLRVAKSQMPVIGLAVASVSSQASQILCVPRSMVEALEGGVCGIAIPPEVVKACVEGNERFKALLDSVKQYSFTASAIIDAAQQSFLSLKDLIDAASNQDVELSNSMDGCLQQISAFVSGIVATAQTAETATALGITAAGI